MATKEQLEFEKDARRKEEARKAKAAGAVRITPPKDINLKGPANPLAGSGRTGGFSAQDAADIGGVIPRARTRVGEAPTAPPPGQLDPAITGVIQRDPAVTAAKPAAEVPPVSPQESLRNTFLSQQGVSPEVQAQDPRVFDAEGTGRAQRRQRIGAGGSEFVNLGAFETEGGPNIFGRAGETGGPINTFVGAGVGDPSAPTQDITPQRGQVQAGGRFAEGFRSTAVDPELQAGIDAFKLRAASGGNLRAGDRQFRGGAASGGTDNQLRQINRINSRADKAFQDALAQGMNTKAAARIAGSIRDSASQLNFQDRTRAGERTAAAQISSQERTAALRQQGELTRLQSTQAREDAASQVELVRDTFTKDTFNAEGDVIGQERDPAAFAQAALQVGGEANLGRVSAQTANTLSQRGNAVSGILDNVNAMFKEQGSNERVNNMADLVKGSKIKGKLIRSETDFMDVIRSPNISIFDIRGEKVTVRGEEMTVGDFFGDEQFSATDLAAFIEMVDVNQDTDE